MQPHPAPSLPEALAVPLWMAQILHLAAAGNAADPRLRDLIVDTYNTRGIALAADGQVEPALACFEAAAAAHPDHAATLSNRANILHLLGRIDAALASNDQALAADKQHLDALFNRGMILFDLERFQEALAGFVEPSASGAAAAAEALPTACAACAQPRT